MIKKKYTLVFFVDGNDVAAGILNYIKDVPPVSAPISGITMQDESHLNGDLTVNEETYQISVEVTEKNGKANQLKVTTTVPNKPFKMRNKEFDRVIIGV